ncbi:UPF0175 family protein [Candidatus Chloroploca asiatica]|uniref:Uncharacterized protein n=1 Tax=Candidatus Chloroploca asiatica TaxID=1506545 RepID=A0A2H3KJY3_9CHLR|nr:UPF0175 family protein [Candidatus Chloroploca asiatica]PDV98229.1 hypothetical protein A9Q02_16440 [Candidatus Chloroploca asiatica]
MQSPWGVMCQHRNTRVRVLPDHATLNEAVEWYLADACSLGRAAELAGTTRWDLLDALQVRGVMQRPGEDRSADELDDRAERLVRQGLL